MLSAVVIAVSGCSRPAVHVKNPGPPILPTGWQTTTDDATGVTLGVPSGWRSGVDTLVDPSSLSGAMSSAGGVSTQPATPDPNSGDAPTQELQQLQNQVAADSAAQEKRMLATLRQKGIILHVIDWSKPIPGEERTRYFVQKVDHPGNWSLEAARDDEVDYFKGWGADPPKSVTLPIGPAYKITADHKTRGGDEVERISYVVLDGPTVYSLRFVSTNNPQAIISIADDVASTWRIPPGKS